MTRDRIALCVFPARFASGARRTCGSGGGRDVRLAYVLPRLGGDDYPPKQNFVVPVLWKVQFPTVELRSKAVVEVFATRRQSN